MFKSTCFTQPTVYMLCSQEIDKSKLLEAVAGAGAWTGTGTTAGAMEGVAI